MLFGNLVPKHCKVMSGDEIVCSKKIEFIERGTNNCNCKRNWLLIKSEIHKENASLHLVCEIKPSLNSQVVFFLRKARNTLPPSPSRRLQCIWYSDGDGDSVSHFLECVTTLSVNFYTDMVGLLTCGSEKISMHSGKNNHFNTFF